MKVLHLFYQSLPDAKGASIRGRDLVESQLALGLAPTVVTCPFQRPMTAGARLETFGGVEYLRTFNGRGSQSISEVARSPLQRLAKFLTVVSFSLFVRRTAKDRKVQVIHAHSMFYCGLAGWVAARTLGIPFVYEIRSLWEDRPHVGAGTLGALQVRLAKSFETFVARVADAVVVISDGLKADIVRRGVEQEKVRVVPNGVMLAPGSTKPKRSGDRPMTFGYVGNLSEIESLDLLLRAAAELSRQGYALRVRIVGDGPAKPSLLRTAEQAPDGVVKFLEPVPPSEVPGVYASLDVSVLARRRTNLTDSVTPLKPLEAAALGVPVLSSDLLAMRELMGKEGSCVFFEAGSIESMKDAMKRMLNGDVDLDRLTDNAFEMVKSSRSWISNAKTYAQLYSDLHRRGGAL